MSILRRLFGGGPQPQSHRAAVYYVTVPEEEPYYVAICECDWFGDFHAESEPAFKDARDHSPDVAPDIVPRP